MKRADKQRCNTEGKEKQTDPGVNYMQQDQTESASRLAAAWMSQGIAVLFFGMGAVQQYIAVWFQDRGLPHVGKTRSYSCICSTLQELFKLIGC